MVELSQSGAPHAAPLLPKGVLKVLPGLPRGMATSHADEVNAELLAFIEG